MHIILLIAYSILLSVAVIRIPFIRKSNIKPLYILIFFWLRCITSWIHNIIAYRFYPNHGDIWEYFGVGKELKAALLQSPSLFIQNLYDHSRPFNFDSTWLWSEISFRLMGALNMLLNFLSFDNLYINSLLFSLPAFAGSIALYRVFMNAFSQQIVCAVTALILPSTLFFTACIHKDGVLYMLLGFFLFYWQRQLQGRFTGRGVLSGGFLFAGILLIRMNLIFGLLPGIIMWTMTRKTRFKTSVNLLITITITTFVIFMAGIIYPAYNLFTVISQRQHEFLALEGKSRIFLPALQPDAMSFLRTLPYAVINGFFQPLPGRGGQMIYNIFSLELLAIWALIAMAVYITFRHKTFKALPAFAWLCIIVTISQLLLIGYTIPFVGAIVRYRSLFLPFMAALALYYLKPLIKVNKLTCLRVNKEITSSSANLKHTPDKS